MKEHAAMESAKGVLQDLVVVVSLVRTLTESFGSASDLYRKLKKKGRELEIKDEDQHHRHPHRRRRDSSSASDSDRRKRTMGRSKSRKRRSSYSDSDEESIYSSTAIVKAEYEHGYDRLGERFAVGDVIAQNQLQTQIIAMQQTIISIYQHCEHQPSPTYRAQLMKSTRAARVAATETLTLLYQRLLPAQEPPIPSTFPIPINSSTELIIPKDLDHRNASRPAPHYRSSRLFCPYARDLQRHPDQPLADAYLDKGDGKCPYCRLDVHTRPGRAWEVILEDYDDRERDVKFLIGNRFVVKSHRDGGGFACILCARSRDSDTVCKENFELVDHVWKEHSVSEVREEEDIREIG